MSKIYYLWNHTETAILHDTYIYLNEKGEKIIGTIVTNNKNNPYHETSVFNKGAYIVGEAVTFVKRVESSVIRKNIEEFLKWIPLN